MPPGGREIAVAGAEPLGVFNAEALEGSLSARIFAFTGFDGSDR